MEQLFDLDKLHKKQNRQRWFRLSAGSVILLAIAVIGVALMGGKHTPTEHMATVGYSGSVSPSSTNTPQSTNTSDLSQQIAQEEAQAAKDEAAAGQDVTNAENMQP